MIERNTLTRFIRKPPDFIGTVAKLHPIGKLRVNCYANLVEMSDLFHFKTHYDTPMHKPGLIKLIVRSIILLALIFFARVPSINAQTLSYSITANNTHLGQITVKKSLENDLIKIEVHSEVNVKILIDIDLTYKLTAYYNNGELVSSSVSTFVNGKLHSSSVTEKINGIYSVTKDGELSKFEKDINYSGAMLYWDQPDNVSKVYSEIDNIEKPIKKIGTGQYQLTEPKSKRTSDYFYSKGTLNRAVIQHRLMTFELNKK